MKPLLTIVAILLLNCSLLAQTQNIQNPKVAIGASFASLDDAKTASQSTDTPLNFPSSLRVGMFVLTIKDGGAFDRAGIKQGDIITRIGDIPMKDISALQKFASTAKVGQSYNVSLMRLNENGTWKWKHIAIMTEAPSAVPVVTTAPTDDTKTAQPDNTAPADAGDNKAENAVSNLQLDGFWGIPFGTPADQAKKVLLSKDGATFDEQHSDGDNLIISGASFGGDDTLFIMLKMDDGKMAGAIVEYKTAANDLDLQTQYDKIHDLLNKKYYETKDNTRLFVSPYEDGDGFEMQAVKQGKGFICSEWKFQSKNGGPNDSIELEISGGTNVVLRYINGAMSAKLDDKKTKKNASDL